MSGLPRLLCPMIWEDRSELAPAGCEGGIRGIGSFVTRALKSSKARKTIWEMALF